MHSLIPPNKPILFHSAGVEKMTLGNGNKLETVLNTFFHIPVKIRGGEMCARTWGKNVC